jgi:hypothetical protein
VEITRKLLRISSSILSLMIAVSAFADGAIAREKHGSSWGNGYRWGDKVTSQQKGLPEYQLLHENDHLVPGMNRTYAMRLEAETGHITPEVDSALKPILKRRQQSQLAPVTVRRVNRKAAR